MRDRFDKAYYDRYYRNPRTRATTPAAVKRQAAFVAAYLKHLEVPVRQVLDVGCGTGNLLRALGREFPRAGRRGIEYSDYLCSAYGWESGSVTDLDTTRTADLVVCNDVLGYLDDRSCAKALGNLAAVADGALYLGVLTREDLELCDSERTDSSQIARPLRWYRRRLEPHFLPVGGGLYLKKPVHVTVWNLERA